MTKTVLTFGDSNTHGTMPTPVRGEGQRFDPQTRWPGVLRRKLGPAWTVIEEGLPGRTANPYPDPTMGPQMNGHLGLRIALESHRPIDFLTIMLGTNDCKTGFGLTAEAIRGHLSALVAIAKHPDTQLAHGGFEILVIAPPLIAEEGIYLDELLGAGAKSAALAGLYEELATHTGVGFLDARRLIQSCTEDGVHFDAQAHAILGAAVAPLIR